MCKTIQIVYIVISALTLLHAAKVQVLELTKGWTLRDSDSLVLEKPIRVAKIPSGIYTDLANNYGDLLEGDNDSKLRWLANKTWIYSTSFDMADELGEDGIVNITFHGIDTVAKIWLNGHLLGETDNMFIRYSYVVGHLLQQSPKHNVLEVELLSPLQEAQKRAKALADKGNSAPPNCPSSAGDVECHRNMLRKMQMSFGGEWNPAALSSGIWKTVAIEYYTVAILRDVDVAINRNETHWTLDCRAFISTPDTESFYAQLVVYARELFEEPFVMPRRKLRYTSSRLEFQIDIPKSNVQLWWPNGYGTQKLYPVVFNLKTFRQEEGPSLSSRTDSQRILNIGFRTIELVEDEDARGRTFYFRVNGQAIFMKGANYVPASTLPELSTDTDAITRLLKSAHERNMNMIRVWGGGLYESDTFYRLADYYGLLVWQDMAFTKATYPATDDLINSMRIETVQNAQRLAYHPSLAMIVTNNEIELYLVKNRSDFGLDAKRLEDEYKLLFMGNLAAELNIISRNDFKPRPGPMISTPSMGIVESGKELAKDPQSPNCGDVHFYDDGDQNNYPEARFVSEFGFPSLPMRSTWLRALGQEATETQLAKFIEQRQHHLNGFTPIIELISNELPYKLHNWQDDIDQFIYFSQVAQAMATKKAVELFRNRRDNYQTMGALIWQLNDVWVAPTWSCIDFYGNYKLVFYWAMDFLSSPKVSAFYTEGSDHVDITVTREDAAEGADTEYYLYLNTYIWSDIYAKSSIAATKKLAANSIEQVKIPAETLLLTNYKKEELLLELILKDNNKEIVDQHYFYPVAIKDIVGVRNPELKLDVFRVDCGTKSPYINSFSLRITIKYPALFVYLELRNTNYTSLQHTFSMNGFTQTVPRQNVNLQFEMDTECIKLTANDFSVKTMNQYML